MVSVGSDSDSFKHLAELAKQLDPPTLISPALYADLQRLQALGLVQMLGESSALLQGDTPPNNARLLKALDALREHLKQAQAAQLLADNSFKEQSELMTEAF